MNNWGLYIVCIISLMSCNSNSKADFNLSGTYFGTLPCVDCKGIQTQLTILPDSSYEYKIRKLTHSTSPIKTTTGKVQIKDEKFTISGVKGDTIDHTYLVKPDFFVKLSNSGQPFDPSQTHFYTLFKEGGNELKDRFWRLIEVDGKDYSDLRARTGNFNAHLFVKSADQRVYGNGGCNSFTGHFLLEENNLFRMERFAHTNINCDYQYIEDPMMRALKATIYYSVKDGRLTLLDLKKRPIARFESDNFQINPYSSNVTF